MLKQVQKYIGRTVQIIYQDKRGHITQRTILIHSVRDGWVKAFCQSSMAPRVFHVDHILAIQPVMRYVV